MEDCYIYRSIKSGLKHTSFHTPGHKGGGALSKILPAAFDVTELSYTDDLSCPAGAIAAAQSDIAMIVGAHKAYITTDGCSSAIMAMIYAASRRGKSLILQRNSHKSVWNACALLGIEPIVLHGEERDGVLLPPTAEQVEKAFSARDDIIGMLVTTPDYYGNIAPIEAYAEVCHSRGKLLIADGAHGAHLAFGGFNAAYAGAYADMWADSAHKTLPVLTQGAAVFLNDASLAPLLEEGLGIFRTTSPSFPIMASVEFGYKYMAANAHLCQRAAELCKEIKNRVGELKFYNSADYTKLCADFGGMGINAALAQVELEKRGIYPEFNDGRYVVFYLSPCTTAADAKKLCAALCAVCGNERIKNTYKPRPRLAFGDSGISYLAAINSPCEAVPLSRAEGRICARGAGIAPPCTPIVAAGERITAAAIKLLKSAKHTFGLNDNHIMAVTDDER